MVGDKHVEIKIRYCLVWNYRPHAARLADELRNTLNVEAKLMPWWIGTYDVIVDGKLVFSKSKFGRFPAPGEVTGMVKGLQERAADSHNWIWQVFYNKQSLVLFNRLLPIVFTAG